MPLVEDDELRRFQGHADIEALLLHAAAKGYDADEIRSVLTILDGIFSSLSFGEHPNYDSLDHSGLKAHVNGAAFVAVAMVGSERADLQSAGLQVFGLLDDQRYKDVLVEALHSEDTWQRLSAIEALGRMSAVFAQPELEVMAQHEDLVTRRAASKTLERLGS